MLKNKKFGEFYDEVAEQVGSNEKDWPILNDLYRALEKAEKELESAGYLKEEKKLDNFK